MQHAWGMHDDDVIYKLRVAVNNLPAGFSRMPEFRGVSGLVRAWEMSQRSPLDLTKEGIKSAEREANYILFKIGEANAAYEANKKARMTMEKK
jgi:hypothetical protein